MGEPPHSRCPRACPCAWGEGVATLYVRQRAATGPMTPFGEQLIGGALLHRAALAFGGGAVSHLTWQIPSDPALIGLEVHAQGSCTRAPASLAPKTFRLRGGLSNALDLTLGF